MTDTIEEYIAEHVQASDLKLNSYVIVRAEPCKVKKVNTGKTGKHGAAKTTMTVINILTDKTQTYACKSTTALPVPKVEKHDWCLTNIDEASNEAYFLDEKNTETVLNLPGENNINEDDKKVKEDILKLFSEVDDQDDDTNLIVTILECFGKHRFLSCKLSTK